jgi:hypothetical protein
LLQYYRAAGVFRAHSFVMTSGFTARIASLTSSSASPGDVVDRRKMASAE